MTEMTLNQVVQEAVHLSEKLFAEHGGHGAIVVYWVDGLSRYVANLPDEHDGIEHFMLCVRLKMTQEMASFTVVMIPTAFDEVPFTSGNSVAFVGASEDEIKVVVCDIENGNILGEPYELSECDAEAFEEFYEIHPKYLLRRSIEAARGDLFKAYMLLKTINDEKSPTQILSSILDAIRQAIIYDNDKTTLKLEDLQTLTAEHSLGPKASIEDRATADLVASHIAHSLRPLVQYNNGFFDQLLGKSPFELAAMTAKEILALELQQHEPLEHV